MKDNARRFSYTDPIQYQGALYPSTVFGVENSRGNVKDTRVFSDRQGQYFALDSQGSPIPVILQQSLPEVEIRPQRKRKADAFGEYLTMSNDRTRVNNVPHRNYNSHLEDRAVKGALSNALWEQEHPNLSSWGYAASALPFAVAASPIAIAAGDAVAGTSLGQAAMSGIGRLMTYPLVKATNTGLGLGFGAKGAYDAGQGDVTPGTLLELTGLYPGIKAAKGLLNSKRFVSELDWSPDSWFGTRANKVYDYKDIASLKSHIPEYHRIEKRAKDNGTWLKMPDGSIWEGDPRSWVQMMSNKYDKYTGNSPFKHQAFSHSSPYKFDTFDYSHFGETDNGFYGRGFYTHPAENINGQLVGRNSYGDEKYLLTTNVQKPLDLNNHNFKYAGLYNRKETNAPKGIFDGYDSVYYGIPGHKSVGGSSSELVVTKPSNYKSLLGNNGDFNPLNPNMYKGLIPLGIISLTGKHQSTSK